ncbi:MAG: M23 family metallopeptidase [Sandaracinaceae bacterium]|nr:M23 family metallopeptidase [Sandaracinaceae bacterium]
MRRGLAGPVLLAAGGLSLLVLAAISPRAEAKVLAPSLTPSPRPEGGAHAPLPGRPSAGSGFGMRSDPFTKQPEFHRGLDIPVPVGTPVYAPFAGTVERVDRDGVGRGVTNGHAVFIRSNDYLWAFLHLSAVLAPHGTRVQKGQLIGRTGQTGRATGPHLHIQVYDPSGRFVDPMTVYPLDTFARRGA